MMEQLIMALGMTALCGGLTAVEYQSLLEHLPADKEYMPIEYHGNNTSAYGFVEADYYEQHNFDPTSFEIDVVPILEDARNENKSGKYRLADGADFLLVYCTMNKALRLAEQQSWRRYKYSGTDEVREPIKTTPLFSMPMKQPVESIKDCVFDGFNFSWLRTGSDYDKAGKLLKNCLRDWKTINNPVVLVKRGKKPVAAIEVGEDGVRQFLGYDNSDAYEVPGLGLAYRKWLVRFHLKDIRYSIYDE